MIFARRFRSAGHTRDFLVQIGPELGWEVREEEDNRVIKRTRIHDWHRVEQAIALFAIEATRLERDGWVEL